MTKKTREGRVSPRPLIPDISPSLVTYLLYTPSTMNEQMERNRPEQDALASLNGD